MANLGNFLETLAFTGAGMGSGNLAGSLAQLAQVRQARQQLAWNQYMQQQKLAMLQSQDERERRERMALQAIAPTVAKEMFPEQEAMQQMMARSPELLTQAISTRMKAAEPTSGMRQFAAFQGMPPEQQQQFLEYQRAMSPFAGAQAFMSPLGAQAEKWKDEAGKSPSPALTPEQATAQGFQPTAKPTEKQQDVAAFVQNAEVAERMLQGLQGWTPTGTLAARNPVSRLVASEQDKRAADFQRAWTMAVLRAESGAVISPAEAEQQIQVYFEQPGDTAQQKADKRKLREAKMESMRNRAGQAYTPLPETAAPTQPASAQDPEIQQLMQSLPPAIRNRIVDIKVVP